MLRIVIVVVLAALIGGVIGYQCERRGPAGGPASSSPPVSASIPVPEPSAADEASASRYEQAFLEGLNLAAAQRYPEALSAFRRARTFRNTTEVKREIETIELVMAQQQVAHKTVENVQSVLARGQTTDAARLATATLERFGDSAAGPEVVSLKRRADALVAAQISDVARRVRHFKEEGERELSRGNKRSALLAFEQALTARPDNALQARHDALRSQISTYDWQRQRAAALRREPGGLDEALSCLEEARKAWDTGTVRRELAQLRQALLRRPERVGVMEFTVRGEVGIPEAGRRVADVLAPHLAPRFEPVGRTALEQALRKLGVTAGKAGQQDGRGQAQLGRLAGVRWLVLGEISRHGGLVVHAERVEAATGLVARTARLAVRSAAELDRRLPELASELTRTPEERTDRPGDGTDQEPAVVAMPDQEADRPLPPPPAEPSVAAEEEPVVLSSRRIPATGGLGPGMIAELLKQGHPLRSEQPATREERSLRKRVIRALVDAGDRLFAAGQFRQASTYYDRALNISPQDRAIRERLGRVRLRVASGPDHGRDRVAVLPFIVAVDRTRDPDRLSGWLPDRLVPHLRRHLDVVDRFETVWWLQRLGLTVDLVAREARARRWLARALDVRYLLFGAVRQTGSLDVTLHLFDVELEALAGEGRVHVRHVRDLAHRLGELVRLTLAQGAGQARDAERDSLYEQWIGEALQLLLAREFRRALDAIDRARAIRPDSEEVEPLLAQARELERRAALESIAGGGGGESDDPRSTLEQDRRLAEEAERARLEAERDFVRQSFHARARHEAHQRWAYQHLVQQGRACLRERQFDLARQNFESAMAIRMTPELYSLMAQARAQVVEDERRRHAERSRHRQTELARERAAVEGERRRRDDAERTHRAAREARDLAEYRRALEQAARLGQARQFDEALALLATARRIKPGEEVDRLIERVMAEQALAAAGPGQGKVELERKLAEEARARAELQAREKQRRETYRRNLLDGQRLLAQKRYDEAAKAYHEALRLFGTDEAMNGVRQVEEARARDLAARAADERRRDEEAKRAQEVRRLVAAGRAAMDQGRHDDAVRAFEAASVLAPDDPEVKAGLAAALQAKARAASPTPTPSAPATPEPPPPTPTPSAPATPEPLPSLLTSPIPAAPRPESGAEAEAARKAEEEKRRQEQEAARKAEEEKHRQEQ
ncbi:MAG: hypothetical protein HY815_27130, partial [Candidatus Riflebacteria bacterium]|nr:hypothetical protein [Candidatus Riflebacteria bacterium]